MGRAQKWCTRDISTIIIRLFKLEIQQLCQSHWLGLLRDNLVGEQLDLGVSSGWVTCCLPLWMHWKKLRLICEHLNVATSVFWACANVGSILPSTHLKTWDVDLIKWRIMTYYYASYELSWHDMDSDPTNMSFMIMNNCVMYPSYYYGHYTVIMIT